MKEIEQKIIETILKHARELLDENWDSISQTLKDMADGKMGIGLAVALDWSESAPKVKTVINYSRKWKDEREDELDDPHQPRLNLGGAQVTMTIASDPSSDIPHDEPEPGPEAETSKRKRRKAVETVE